MIYSDLHQLLVAAAKLRFPRYVEWYTFKKYLKVKPAKFARFTGGLGGSEFDPDRRLDTAILRRACLLSRQPPNVLVAPHVHDVGNFEVRPSAAIRDSDRSVAIRLPFGLFDMDTTLGPRIALSLRRIMQDQYGVVDGEAELYLGDSSNLAPEYFLYGMGVTLARVIPNTPEKTALVRQLMNLVKQ